MIRRGGFMFVSYHGGVNIKYKKISLMMMHDEKRMDNESKRRQVNSNDDKDNLTESR